METTIPPIANPIRFARVVGESVSQEEYSYQIVDRGQLGYRVRRSDLLVIRECPSKWRAGYSRKMTKAAEWGSAVDTILLYPEKVNDLISVRPKTYVNAQGEVKPWTFAAKVCKAWKKEQGDRLVLDNETFTQAENAAKLYWSNSKLRALMRSCPRKQVYVEGDYLDKDTELIIPLKCLIDLEPADDSPFAHGLADLKTTSTAIPRVWQRHVFEEGYDIQAALNLDLWNKANNQERDTFYHAIIESSPPWQTACRFLSNDFITLGRMRYIEALKTYARCLKTAQWPDYDTDDNGLIWEGWLCTDVEPWMVR